jgi:hypothetical protein
LEVRRDLAVGKPWRASSKYGFGGGCQSPEQTCPENVGYFFHTEEERSPWIEFDLGAARSFSVVRVEDRIDFISDRAVPLVIEVSENHRTWRAVARKETEFVTWRASFATVHARWVRLRADKKTWLHLYRVRIAP